MHGCRPSSSFVPENKGTDVIPSPGPARLFPVSHPLVQLVYFGLPFMQRAVPTSPGDHIPQETTIPHDTDATKGISGWQCSKAERAAVLDGKQA